MKQSHISFTALGRLSAMGMTLIILGYLTTWLPGPGAGLTLIGLEMAEWVKFLPEVQSGAVGPRLWLSLPPVTLSLIMMFYTAPWPERRWQTWAMRWIAILISLLALPPIEVILGEPRQIWQGFALLVLLVILALLVVAALSRIAPQLSPVISAVGLILASMAGFIFPTLVFVEVRPIVSSLFGVPIGTGMGVWLNATGHILAGTAMLAELRLRSLQRL